MAKIPRVVTISVLLLLLLLLFLFYFILFFFAVKVVQTEEEVLQCNVTIQIRATEQFFAVVSLIMLFKIILTSESVSQILKCDHSNEVSEHYHAPVVLFIMFIMLYDITRKYTTRKILKNRDSISDSLSPFV